MNSAVLAVAVASAVAFVLSSTYYTVFSEAMAAHSAAAAAADGRTPAWKVLLELLRSLVLSTVLVFAATEMGLTSLRDAALLGLAAWIGFPLMLWTGAMLWENTRWQLAALHAGDWLVKLLVVSAIVVLLG